MTKTRDSATYTAYLMRRWLEGASWRYSLQEVGSRQCRGFATLDELVSFLVALSTVPGEDKLTTGEPAPEPTISSNSELGGTEGGPMELSSC